jgi:quinol monooxygenase YgiN
MAQANFIKMYTLQPGEDLADEFLEALRTLSASLSTFDACLSCILLENKEATGTFVFIERWRSFADYKSASSRMDGSLFAPFGRLLTTKPQIHELEELPLG